MAFFGYTPTGFLVWGLSAELGRLCTTAMHHHITSALTWKEPKGNVMCRVAVTIGIKPGGRCEIRLALSSGCAGEGQRQRLLAGFKEFLERRGIRVTLERGKDPVIPAPKKRKPRRGSRGTDRRPSIGVSRCYG